MMRLKYGFTLFIGIITLTSGAAKDSSDVTSGDETDDVTKSQNSNIQQGGYNWLPRLNITCIDNKVKLADNPNCLAGFVTQQWKCWDGVSKTTSSRDCATSERTIDCTKEQVLRDSTSYEGDTWNDPNSENNSSSCTVIKNKNKEDLKCQCGRAAVGGPEGPENGAEDISAASNPIKTIAFGMAGTVMVGLLGFAMYRIRKAAVERREREPTYNGHIQGIDNAALGALPPESRVQAILNTINASGRSFELRERADSAPGRRVYVLSPTTAPPGGVDARGRVFTRTRSQLSSIAEESTEDALSHITETSEPMDDDCVFRYDSDAINEQSSDCAFEEDAKTRPASSSEAINCINDVIALYDVENDVDNGIDDVIKANGVITPNDFRRSVENSESDYLENFGWKPQERAWKIEKLKDSASKSNERLFASCSTLNSQKSGASSSASLGNGDVTMTTDDMDSMEPLLGNGDVTSSNLKSFRSLPSVLDTSQIPEIEELLSADDVTEIVIEENGKANGRPNMAKRGST